MYSRTLNSVGSGFESSLENTTSRFRQSDKNISSLKMDEIATEQRVR